MTAAARRLSIFYLARAMRRRIFVFTPKAFLVFWLRCQILRTEHRTFRVLSFKRAETALELGLAS
jgi:hypothetical protein